MDIGPLQRPNIPSAQPVVRTDAPAVVNAVETQLPAAASVTAAAETSAARVDISRTARTLQAMDEPEAQSLRRETTRDDESRSLVYRVTDQRTGEVVQQIPEETLLRLRAYIAEQQQRRAEAGAGLVEVKA